MKIKKIVISFLTLAVAFSLLSPALAKNDDKENKGKGKAFGLEKRDGDRDERKATSTKPVVKFARRAATITGELVSVAGSVASTTLVVKAGKVTPKKAKKWIGAYPEGGKEITVKIDEKTKIVRKYYGKSSLEELTVGDKLHIVVKTNEDGTVTAQTVRDDSLHITLKVYNGNIESLNVASSSFVLKQNAKKSFTINTDAKTKFVVPDVASSTFANLKVGDRAHVRGVINTKTKVITASVVRVIPPEPVVVPPVTPPVVPPTTTPTSTP